MMKSSSPSSTMAASVQSGDKIASSEGAWKLIRPHRRQIHVCVVQMELLMLSGGVLLVLVLTLFLAYWLWPGALLKAYNW